MNKPMEIAKIRADIRMLMDETMRINSESGKLRREARWAPLMAAIMFVGGAVIAGILIR